MTTYDSDPSAVSAPRYQGALLAVLAVLGALVLLAAAMARVATYDEDQYLAAGLFVAQGMLPYRDFAYLQAPLYPFVLGALFKLTGGWYLLAGRLLTFGLAVLSAALLWRVLRRLGAGPLLSSVLLAACLASPFLAAPLANARNDVLPLTLFLGGLLVQLRSADDRRPQSRRAAGAAWDGVDRRVAGGGRGPASPARVFLGRFGAAVLMGLAVEAKVSFVFAPLVLLGHALFMPRVRLLPVVLGLAVAAVPLVALVAVSGIGPVRFGLLDYHLAAPLAWYRAQGLEAQLDAPVRLAMVLGWLVLGGNLTLVALAGALSMITMARKRGWKRPGPVLLALFVGAAVVDFLPSPSWAMYFAVLAPLLACCIAHLDRITTHLADPARKQVLYLVAALPVVPVLMAEGPEIARFVRGDWVGVAAHESALRVRAAVGGGTVATLFPHAVMDANPVPVAFASGPFVFRSGAAFPPALLAGLHALRPDMLAGFIEREKPAAIFAGSYGGVFRAAMDQPLTAYAEGHGWRLVLTEPDGGRLWLNPASK